MSPAAHNPAPLQTILNEPDEIIGQNGQKIPRRLTVDYMSFSAHVDYAQNSKFIDEVNPSHVVLVHGEANTMSRLRAALQKRYKDRNEDVKVHTPRNCEPLHLTFRGDRTAKIIGTLAKNPPKPDDLVTGLLVSKDFAYTILDPSDLADFTGLSMSTIIQRQRVALHIGWDLVRWHLEGMYGSITEGVDLEDHRTIRVMDVVDIKQTGKHELTLEWVSSIPSDMVADATVALLLGISSSRASVKLTTKPHSHAHEEEEEEELDVEANAHPYAARAHAHKHKPSPPTGSNMTLEQAQQMLAQTEAIVALLEAQIGPVEETVVGEGAQVKAEGGDAEMQNGKATAEEGEEGGHQEPRAVAMQAIKAIKGPARLALLIWLDDECAAIETESLIVTSSSASLKARVSKCIKMALQAIMPLSDTFKLEAPLSTNLFKPAPVAAPVKTEKA